MRREGPVTVRHLFAAVVMVLLVNAQLTWWIVFALRENRTRLRLEREDLVAACRLYAVSVDARLGALAAELERRLLGDETASSFRDLRRIDDGGCRPGWTNGEAGLQLVVRTTNGCWIATLDPIPAAALTALPPELEIVQSDDATLPSVALPPPWDGDRVRPHPDRWQQVLDRYTGRIVMMVAEGSFFAVVLLAVLYMLWQSFRREVTLERQHQSFLSAITHELKSPLAAVRLSLETVIRGRADADTTRRFLDNAMQDVERLQGLVQKVLQVTRYARGHGSLVRRSIDLADLAEEAAAAFRPRAAAVGAHVETDLRRDVWAEVDPEAIRIVISNLLENAAKYGGRPPEIRLRVACDDERAVLEVSDNGAGIPEAERELVFQRFWRGGNEMTRTTEGTGLGLHLVQQIVSAHRGSIAVHSAEGDGSTFRITLPGAEPVEDAV